MMAFCYEALKEYTSKHFLSTESLHTLYKFTESLHTLYSPFIRWTMLTLHTVRNQRVELRKIKLLKQRSHNQ